MAKRSKADAAKGYLLENGCIPSIGFEGFQKLCDLVDGRQSKLIQAYLDLGVNLNLHTEKAYAFVGNSPLVKCIKNTDTKLSVIKKLLKFGANPNALVYKQSPLSYAIAADRRDVMELLLEAGASLDFKDNPMFETSIEHLHKNDQHDLLEQFLDYPANQSYLRKRDKTSLLVRVCWKGNVELAQYLIDKGIETTLDLGDKTLANYSTLDRRQYQQLSETVGFDAKKKTLPFLLYANDKEEVLNILAIYEETQDVEGVLKAITDQRFAYELAQTVIYKLKDWKLLQGIDAVYPLKESPNFNYNLLEIATNENPLFAKLFPLFADNDLIIKSTIDQFFKYPTYNESINEVTELLLPHFDPAYSNRIGENPLHLLINTEYIQLETLNKLAEIYDPKAGNNFGKSALEYANTRFNKTLPHQFRRSYIRGLDHTKLDACQHLFTLILNTAAVEKMHSLIEQILSNYTFTIDELNAVYFTAVENDDLTLMDLLLEKTTVDLSQVRRYGDTLLHRATSKDMLERLVDRMDVNIPNRNFKTPVFNFGNRRDCLDLLLEKGALLTPYPAGVNFIMTCLWKNSNRYYDYEEENRPPELSEEDMLYFLEKGADPNIFVPKSPTSKFQNAFIALVENKKFLNVMLTNTEQPILNYFDEYGDSPLNVAIRREEPRLVKLLLDHGADWNARAKPKSKSALEVLFQKRKWYAGLKAVFEEANGVFPLPEPEIRNPICTTEYIGDSPYEHSFYAKAKTQVYTSESTGENPIFMRPKWKAVSKLKIKGINGKLAAITRLDLTEFGLDGHKVPLFYHEAISFDWLFGRLDDDNQVTHIEAYNGTDLCVGLEEEEFNEFEDGCKLDKSFKNTFFVVKTQKENNTEAHLKNYFGTIPKPIQNGFAIPKYKGESLRFVGQYSAYDFGLADIEFYLFYDAKERVFAQLLQMT